MIQIQCPECTSWLSGTTAEVRLFFTSTAGYTVEEAEVGVHLPSPLRLERSPEIEISSLRCKRCGEPIPIPPTMRTVCGRCNGEIETRDSRVSTWCQYAQRHLCRRCFGRHLEDECDYCRHQEECQVKWRRRND